VAKGATIATHVLASGLRANETSTDRGRSKTVSQNLRVREPPFELADWTAPRSRVNG
jgi:hypothetical protein